LIEIEQQWNVRDACGFIAGSRARRRRFPFTQSTRETEQQSMDKDRIKGAAEQAKGKMKEQASKLTGDKKLETEGKVDKTAGKVQNTIGGIKDSLRDH
jgi:uncharacterized protein YjbJ (UPF0337 family)